jgi:hypothetical protein
MEIQIIRNASPPPNWETRGRKPKYPFGDLEPGDAFDVTAGEEHDECGNRNRIQSRLASIVSKKNREAALSKSGVKYIVRFLRDERVVRVWRVS